MGVGEGSVFFGPVVSDGVAADDPPVVGDLHSVTDYPYLNRLAPILVAGPIRGSGEADTPRRVDLAGHRHSGGFRSNRPAPRPSLPHGWFVLYRMLPGV